MRFLALVVILGLCVSCGGGGVVPQSSGGETLEVATNALPDATVGHAYSFQVKASGGSGMYSWSAVGVPKGMSLSGSGVLSGVPASSGKFTVQFTVKDASN